MSNDSDGLDEPIEQAFQHALMLAGQVGSSVSQAWKQRMTERANADRAQAAQVLAQYQAERSAALQVLRTTDNPQWWDKAGKDDVAQIVQLSTAWKEHSLEAAAADDRIRDEIKTRYGIDASAVESATTLTGTSAGKSAGKGGVDEDEAKELTALAAADRLEAEAAHREEDQELHHAEETLPTASEEEAYGPRWTREQESVAEGHEQAAAIAGMTVAEKWDSAERRENLAEHLRSKAVPEEAVMARLHAERQHAHPITASVKAGAAPAQKTKVSTAPGQVRTQKKQL